MQVLLVFILFISTLFAHPTAVHGSTETNATAESCGRAYAGISPWNTKITNPVYHPRSNAFIATMTGPFGSDPTQYTLPVYTKTDNSPLTTIRYRHLFSLVKNYGQTLAVTTRGGSMVVPIPTNAEPSKGSDSQVIFIDPATGDEWGFYHAAKATDGTWTAENGYHYNIHWSGVPPIGFTSRGAGVPYLAGLIRKCEITQGHIDHAIAFAYQNTCTKDACARDGVPYFVAPATKSDGKSTVAHGMPEGTRLQLDPNATEAEIKSWCTGGSRINEQSCRIIVRTLQTYGMILIDTAGHPKMYAESSLTAEWGNLLNDKTPSKIPYAAFRVVAF
jgi:hypothetical protein